jgi:hypothetical protein
VWAVAMFCLWHAIEIEQTINPAPLTRSAHDAAA